MSTQKLTELPSILYDGIDYDTTIEEIKSIIENNPNWKENWTSYYNSEAGTMLIQLMAWISDNLGVKQDLIYNEMFIGTAQDDSNIIRHLNQIGYKPTMAKSARGKLHIEANTFSNSDIILTPKREADEDISERINKIFRFSGKDVNGDQKEYEILQYTNDKPDYMSEVALKGGTTSFDADINGNPIYAYEGRTVYEEFYSDSSDGPTFEISNENIDSGTIRIYDITGGNVEFNNVSSFVSLEAKDEKYNTPYVIEYTTNKKYRIRFASTGVMTYGGQVNYSRLYPAGHNICVIYRTTSGSLGNSPIGFLKNTSIVENIDKEAIQIEINNSEACSGGSDEEKLSDAALNAPLSLRTMDRAVTPSDFNYLLSKNPNILKIKTYTPSNQPNNFKNYFGRNINPQEAFAFVALNKNYKNVPTSKYKYFPWITMNKEAVLNEEYCFDAGVFNKDVSYSRMYNAYSVVMPNGRKVFYENARIIEMPVDFCSQIVSENTSGIAVKLSTEKSNEEFFANIPFSLEYDSGDDDYNTYMTVNGETSAEESTDILRREIEKHAQFISTNSFGVNEPIDCRNAIVKVYLDEKTGVDIDLFDEVNEECYRFITNSNPLVMAPDSTNEGKAKAKDGIVETINKRFIELYTKNREYATYDENHAVQCVGLDFGNSITEATGTFRIDGESNESFSGNSFVVGIGNEVFKLVVAELPFDEYPIYPDSKQFRPGEFYKRIGDDEWISGLNCLNAGYSLLDSETGLPIFYMRNNKGNKAEIGSLEDIAFRITYALANPESNKVYIYRNNDFIDIKEIAESQELCDELKSIRCSVVRKFTFDENSGKNASLSYDLVFESLNNRPLINNELVINFNPNVIISNDTVKAYTYFNISIANIPASQKAVSYRNIASAVPSENKYRLKIESPLTGKSSSIYFEKPTAGSERNDLLGDYFGLGYVGQTSDKATGIRRLDLYLADTAGATYNGQNIAEDSPKAGYFILQDNIINSENRYSNIYANYKLQYIDTLELGSVYENFYLTGDKETDEENKPEIISIDGQSVIKYNDAGVTRYKIDEIKSNFDIRFTKKIQDTNSLASIKTDLDVVKADLIKIPTAQITKEIDNTIPCPDQFIFSVDDNEPMEINIGIKYDTIGDIDASSLEKIIYEAITNSGSDEINIKNINDDIKENAYSIINKSYKYLNQLEIGNYTKNSSSNVTFYHCSGASYEEEKALYKKIFGTKYTNPDLFELYKDDIEQYETEEGGFCPREEDDYNKIKFTYKKKMPDGKVRDPDYFIEINHYTDAGGNIKYKFNLKKTQMSKFPDAPFYIHFTNDRTYALDSAGNKIEYDEDILQNYMKNYKISGTDIYFLKPFFKTFDIAATIHYNTNFNLSDIKVGINKAVEENFGFDKADINKNVSKSKIIKTIMNVPGVESVNVEYFGLDYTNQYEYQDETYEIAADFYEILFLHEDEEKEHGKIFNYVAYGD